MSTLVSTTRLPAQRSEWMARLRAGWQRLSAWRRAQRAMRELPRLDEHTLRDLGLTHGELLSCWAEAEGLVEATRLRVWSRLDGRHGL